MSENMFRKNQTNKRQFSERTLAFVVGISFFLILGLMVFYYRTAASGKFDTTPTPLPPTSTPICNESGTSMPIQAFFPALLGESFFAKATGGETLLVDAGYAEDADTLLAFLNGQNVSKLDAVFLTLPEERYIGGMAEIVDQFPIDRFFLTPEAAADSRSAELLALLKEKSIPTQEIHASFVSTVFWAPNAELRILSPHDVSYENQADESLMLRLKYGSSEILLAGSAQALAERMTVKALPNELLHADVLKLANRGSSDSSTQRFLSAVKPNIAILLGSGENAMLSDDVLQRLKAQYVRVLATAEFGTIEIMLDGVEAKVVE